MMIMITMVSTMKIVMMIMMIVMNITNTRINRTSVLIIEHVAIMLLFNYVKNKNFRKYSSVIIGAKTVY